MIKRIGQGKVLHRAVVVNGMAYIAGVTADDVSLDMEGQTREICQKLDTYLESVGSDKTKLVTAQVFLADFSGKDAMNRAWTAWLSAEHFPTRATVGVNDLGKDTLVEIVVTAAVG